MDERNYVAVYIHLVWGTLDRQPLLTGDLQRDMYRVLESECLALECAPVAVGGTADHVHLLVRLSAEVAVADLVAHVQERSAQAFRRKLVPNSSFRWPSDYSVVTVSPEDLAEVSAYIADQREHHETKTLVPDFEL